MPGTFLKNISLAQKIRVAAYLPGVQKLEACSKKTVCHESFMTPGWNTSIAIHKNFTLAICTLLEFKNIMRLRQCGSYTNSTIPCAHHTKKWGTYKEYIQGVQNMILCNWIDAELVPGRLKGLIAHRIQQHTELLHVGSLSWYWKSSSLHVQVGGKISWVAYTKNKEDFHVKGSAKPDLSSQPSYAFLGTTSASIPSQWGKMEDLWLYRALRLCCTVVTPVHVGDMLYGDAQRIRDIKKSSSLPPPPFTQREALLPRNAPVAQNKVILLQTALRFMHSPTDKY